MAEIDPVSGNEIPPGGTPEGVRDDVPANLSEGEFVMPEFAVNFYGPEFFDNLIQNAKNKLGHEDMEEAPPQMSNDEEEDIPDSDIVAMEDEAANFIGYALGGLVVSRQNYAEGGEVTPFSRDDWTVLGSSLFDDTGELVGDGETSDVRTYVNAKGEILNITFIDGEPLQPIPDGYYPEGQLPTTPPETPGASARILREDSEPKTPRSGIKKANPYSAWGGKNPYELTEEELLEGAKGFARTGGILNKVGPIAGKVNILAGAGVMALKGNSVANLKAAQMVAEAQGYSAASTEIGKMIDDIDGSGMGEAIYDQIAPGTKIFDRWTTAYNSSSSDPISSSEPATSRSSSSGGGSSSGGYYNRESDGGGSRNPSLNSARESTNSSDLSFGNNVGSTDKSVRSSGDFLSGDPTSRQSESLSFGNNTGSVSTSSYGTGNASDYSTGSSDDDDDDEGLSFVKGGLVEKRKKATRKNTAPKKKG